MNNKRILITGGGGFIGYHLAVRLAEDLSNRITLVENFARGHLDHDLEKLCELDNVELITLDLLSPGVFDSIGKDYDEVYHMAAILGVENVLRHPVDVLRVNAVATVKLLEWFVAGGGKKLMFPSTSEVYAWTQSFHPIPVPTPEDVPLSLTDIGNPRSSYAGSKMFGELAVTHYCQAYDKPFVITRYHNVYGPRMGQEHVVPQLYKRAAFDHQSPLVVYSSEYSRAFCYVSDAVTGTICCMRHPNGIGNTFNIGNDEEEITIGALAQRILSIAGISTAIAPQPAVNDPIVRRCPNINKARKLIGYEPGITLEEGLTRTINWYAQSFESRSDALR